HHPREVARVAAEGGEGDEDTQGVRLDFRERGQSRFSPDGGSGSGASPAKIDSDPGFYSLLSSSLQVERRRIPAFAGTTVSKVVEPVVGVGLLVAGIAHLEEVRLGLGEVVGVGLDRKSVV